MNSPYSPKTDLHAAENPSRKHFDPNLWIVPFSDFMTILMIFYLSLYVMSLTGSSLQNEIFLMSLEESMGSNTSKHRKIVETADKIKSSITSRGLQKLANVEVNAQQIKIVMAAPILFAVGSAEVSDEARPLLDELAGILQKIPNRVIVEGHTCDLPVSVRCAYRSNLELSGARAFGFIKYIIEKEDLNPDRFVALGCGENKPIKPNDSEENRAMNRRVEIIIEK